MENIQINLGYVLRKKLSNIKMKAQQYKPLH